MIPTHCDLPMIRDKRYKIMEIYRCAACNIQISAPKGYFDDNGEDVAQVGIQCAREGCQEVFNPSEYNRSHRFHSKTCAKADQRQRRRSEQLSEEVSA